jgi:hypothetical protein
VASIIALLNDYRITNGQRPLGLLNSWLYGIGRGGFNDITSGQNPGCGTQGFQAVPGWDAVRSLLLASSHLRTLGDPALRRSRVSELLIFFYCRLAFRPRLALVGPVVVGQLGAVAMGQARPVVVGQPAQRRGRTRKSKTQFWSDSLRVTRAVRWHMSCRSLGVEWSYIEIEQRTLNLSLCDSRVVLKGEI